MINRLRTKKFYRKNYQTKKIKLERFLLKHVDCNIGNSILCFEDRDLAFDCRFARTNSQPEKRMSFTVGRVYKILSKSSSKIKIKGDSDKMVWTTANRFLGQKALRKIKLEELNKISKLRKFHTE